MSHTTTLYRFFSATDQLLYIGITKNGPRRWDEHAAQKAWWVDVAKVTTCHFDTREEALDAEKDAIISEQPLHNITHNKRRRQDPKTYAEIFAYAEANGWAERARQEAKRGLPSERARQLNARSNADGPITNPDVLNKVAATVRAVNPTAEPDNADS